ncbi:hypothetical protein SUGI_0575930 [Cryptomeria japonica]|nr:hypothetical protein SUGI_0575930 [Cryptomeria japonica]
MYNCTYEIVNVVEKRYQVVGYLPYNSSKLFRSPTFGNEGLRSVIWLGGFSTVPREWKYDAVVGDVTITANRTCETVDFTQPFKDTGLVMLARTTIKEEANNGWTFLQPFTPVVWATTAAFV